MKQFVLIALIAASFSATLPASGDDGCGQGYHVCAFNRCCEDQPSECNRCLMHCCNSFTEKSVKLFDTMNEETENLIVSKTGQVQGSIRSSGSLTCVRDATNGLASCSNN
jgi:hypothetical protein